MRLMRLSGLSLPLMLLIVSGCAGFPKRPSGHVYHLNTIEGAAYEMSVPTKAGDDFKYTGNKKPIAEMDKYFAISPSYMLDLKFWIEDVKEYAEDKCK